MTVIELIRELLKVNDLDTRVVIDYGPERCINIREVVRPFSDLVTIQLEDRD